MCAIHYNYNVSFFASYFYSNMITLDDENIVRGGTLHVGKRTIPSGVAHHTWHMKCTLPLQCEKFHRFLFLCGVLHAMPCVTCHLGVKAA